MDRTRVLGARFHPMARVLLVEDHDLVRRFLCDAIKHAGHEAQCVGTKAEAEEALALGSHDLVLANVRLPDGSGHDVAATANGLGVKTVLLTGHPDEALALEIAEVTHLRKPFKLTELTGLIESVLGGSSQPSCHGSD